MRALTACLCVALLAGACAPPHVPASPPPGGPGQAVARPVAAASADALAAQGTPAAQGTQAPGRIARVSRAVSRAQATPQPAAHGTPGATQPGAAAQAVEDVAALAPGARGGTRGVPLLDGVLDGLLPDADAPYGLVLEDLASGARTEINATQVFPSASLYKLALAWVTLRRVDAAALSLDASLPIEDEDAGEPEPDDGVGPGDSVTIAEALEAMLSVSSNAAAHALLRLVGRSDFADEMQWIGLTQTQIPDDSLAVTSAADIARLLRLIATSPDLSGASRELLARDMANIAPPDALRDTLPDTVGIVDKTGNLEDASNVGALLESPRGTAILVVIDSGVDPGDARAVIAQAGLIAYHALLQE